MTLNLLHNHEANLDAGISVDMKPQEKIESKPDKLSLLDASATDALRPQFWSRFTLAELNHSEWEALCDGCGSCCLIKYMDDDNEEEVVEYTDVTCQLMNCATGYCQHYDTRQEHVPDCIQLTIDNLPDMMWLPSHCAYKRLYKGQNLPSWHMLLTQDAVVTQQQMRAANVGVAGRCVSEIGMSDEDMEMRVVTWVTP
ncbi:YcgN family cysteine cluster protein [Psychrobacter sp. FME5]|nr:MULTISPECIES: YcgN family cysteine cluster protein [unclassified Psychrobacter]MBE0407681.1 YcgN family cysteine cluster protein [Psychrobacter sp. FME6]MBE0444951.1 YcgN family cysteine cluster protein [Psychrobacter sp. FME5]MDN5898107.1 YcgN family cysteine cluster protein [Psychrobacter sp.]